LERENDLYAPSQKLDDHADSALEREKVAKKEKRKISAGKGL